jgi:SagB-type dehydrogenase family enzyme
VEKEFWETIRLSLPAEDQLWEVFHENSKIGRYSTPRSEQEVLQWTRSMHESLPFDGYPRIELPRSFPPFQLSLTEAITMRSTERALWPCPVPLDQLAAILHHAYGVTRLNEGTTFPRPFRTVPSAGALYPLELFFHTAHTEGLTPGLYHYNPSENCLRMLREGNETQRIADAFIQPSIGLDASVILFITAVFERTIFKYEDRGYRFVMLEAGHVTQNVNLSANALRLGCINVGGFRDREIDNFLELDGVTQSTIYIIGIGGRS